MFLFYFITVVLGRGGREGEGEGKKVSVYGGRMEDGDNEMTVDERRN